MPSPRTAAARPSGAAQRWLSLLQGVRAAQSLGSRTQRQQQPPGMPCPVGAPESAVRLGASGKAKRSSSSLNRAARAPTRFCGWQAQTTVFGGCRPLWGSLAAQAGRAGTRDPSARRSMAHAAALTRRSTRPKAAPRRAPGTVRLPGPCAQTSRARRRTAPSPGTRQSRRPAPPQSPPQAAGACAQERPRSVRVWHRGEPQGPWLRTGAAPASPCKQTRGASGHALPASAARAPSLPPVQVRGQLGDVVP